mgnify:CR=1 FL=1
MDKLGEEVNKYIDKLQDDIAIYLKEIENQYFDSTEYLELKVNNYLISIKEDIIYEFYKYLEEKDYEIDAIEMYKNKLNTKLEKIYIKLEDNKYCKLKESFNEQLIALNVELEKLIDIKTEWFNSSNDCITERTYNENGDYRLKIYKLERSLREKINKLDVSLKENLGIYKINYDDIKNQLDKKLNVGHINARILKRDYKRELYTIQEEINEHIANKSKIEFSKTVKNALQTTIDTLKEEINNINHNKSENNDKSTEAFEFTRSIEDIKSYQEKEEIESILITTSLGKEIFISIDDCKKNMKEISFNRAMTFINKLIEQCNKS